jgi:hypothetical protein
MLPFGLFWLSGSAISDSLKKWTDGNPLRDKHGTLRPIELMDPESELKPYDNPEYPKFIGTYLFRTFRRDLSYDKEAEHALNEAEKNCKEGQRPSQWLIEKYGEEKGNALNIIGHGSSTVSASWECRGCIILDEKEYFEKLWESTEDNNNEQ